ncbi:S-adenosyl-L-methionine-dependent methyltransferase [Spinellus fusiger]|nr:S-adenosyl-L-methionine-dependent methyltransferase [Spinellus fusiger]
MGTNISKEDYDADTYPRQRRKIFSSFSSSNKFSERPAKSERTHSSQLPARSPTLFSNKETCSLKDEIVIDKCMDVVSKDMDFQYSTTTYAKSTTSSLPINISAISDSTLGSCLNVSSFSIPNIPDVYDVSGTMNTDFTQIPELKNMKSIDIPRIYNILHNNRISKRGFYVFDYGAEKEYERQTRQHYVLKRVFDGNVHVPLKNPSKILDVACGVGLWALEMGQEYPNCKVIGIDILPNAKKAETSLANHKLELSTKHLKDSIIVQPNVKCIYGDITLPLIFPDNEFDFVFQRDVGTFLPHARWPGLLADMYRITKPGGQIEMIEHDFFFKNPGPLLVLLNDIYRLTACNMKVHPYYNDCLEEIVRQSGFVDLHISSFDVPVGEWPENEVLREYGFLYKQQIRQMLYSMRRWWNVELGVSYDDYDAMTLLALKEIEEYKCVINWKIYTARKSTDSK